VSLVFVYGSLLSGLGNHRLLASARFFGRGITQPVFTMGDLGSYPGVAAGGRTAIVGEVYEVDDETLAGLDMLEGHPRFYERIQVGVTIEGRARRAWIYLLPRAHVVRLPRVYDGDWRRRCVEHGEQEEELTT
jgi:gamma-glutamylaminecyclotransferase